MFESLQGNCSRSIAERLRALLLSVFIHGLVVTLIVVLPLLFVRVLPGRDLMTFLIAAPEPPPPPPPPIPHQNAPVHAAAGIRVPVIPWLEFQPSAVPKGIPPPTEEPPVIGVAPGLAGFIPGVPGGAGLTGTGVPGSVLGPTPPPVPLPPPPAPRKEPLRVGGTVQESKLIKKVLPDYPDLARRAHVEDVVSLEVTIDEEGSVSSVKVLRGHLLLIDEAVRAVRQWKYSPTLLNGEPFQVVSNVTVIFQLK